ncbi:MAG: response regulator [Chloroflexi bacterium]|nr:response regulator [Chloroflexota bacterium]
MLVVDDTPVLRLFAAEVLSGDGYEVLEAEDGREAVALAREFAGPIDLLLTDVVMPRMGGAQLARTLAGDRPGICVLFMSAYVGDSEVLDGVRDGRLALISKPFSPSDLRDRVRGILTSAAATPRRRRCFPSRCPRSAGSPQRTRP